MVSLGGAIGDLAAAGIRRWVRLTGRRVARDEAPWLDCPMGPPGRIGGDSTTSWPGASGSRSAPHPTRACCRTSGAPGPGLRPDGGPARDPPLLRAHRLLRPGSLERGTRAHAALPLALTRFVSRRMDQLNFPVSSLELSGGMTSDILPMVDAAGRARIRGGSDASRTTTGWSTRACIPSGIRPRTGTRASR